MRGPDSLDGWTLHADSGQGESWDYRGGALISTGASNGGIRRDAGLPPLARIEFDALVRPKSVFGVSFYSGKQSLGYLMQFDNSVPASLLDPRLALRAPRHAAQRCISLKQNARVPVTSLKGGKMHVDIRLNKELKTISLYLDGKSIIQFLELG